MISDKEAPQWVYALQAALHADMEDDDFNGSKRRGRRDLDSYQKGLNSSQDQLIGDLPVDSADAQGTEEAKTVKKIFDAMISQDKKENEKMRSSGGGHRAEVAGFNRMKNEEPIRNAAARAPESDSASSPRNNAASVRI
jgi:hypothetical protein